MLDADEHSGIFTFLVGIIVLVLVAVGFSLVLDKRFKFSSGREVLKDQIALQADELEALARSHEHQSALLASSSVTRRGNSKESSDLGRRVEALGKQKELLLGKKVALQEELTRLGTEFSQYRASYRARTWSGAVGEKLGDISIRGGREYKDARIAKVTDVGLEIRHEHGIARIQAPDLPAAMQDRFQWDDEERRRRLDDEDKSLHGTPDETVADQEAGENSGGSGNFASADTASDEREEKRARIREYRQKVRAWKRKVSTLAAERSEARSNSYGNSNSVPGKLETWSDKSARLSKELARARGELEKARARLASVSPDDQELKREPER